MKVKLVNLVFGLNKLLESPCRWLGYAGLVVVTLLTRFYQLGRNPLWLDELYSYQVSTQDLATILRNSLYETHPPLYDLLLKATSGFGLWRTEWGIRWFSAVCGTVTLIIFYYLVSRLINRWSALWGWLLLLFSPTVMYYSQEARPYIVDLLVATLTTTILLSLLDPQKSSRRLWFAWGIFSIIGIYIAYSYLLVLLVQAGCLILAYRVNRRMITTLGLVVLGLFPLPPIMLSNLTRDLQAVNTDTPLTFIGLVQALLAGGQARYGLFWGSIWLPILFGLLAVLGLWALFERRNIFAGYIILQVVFPLGMYFLVGAFFFHWRMPNYQSRQFLVLLPAFFLWVVLGLDWCARHLLLCIKYSVVIIVSIILLTASLAGLERYWTITKSPEGLATQLVRQYLEPGEAVVSLHYSLTAAASFYLTHESKIYTAPQPVGSDYLFDDNPLLLIGQVKLNPRFSLATVRAHPGVWILSDTRWDRTVRNILIQDCRITVQQMFGPFEVVRIEQCPL